MGVKIEVCCGSATDVIYAAEGGAHRAELCSSLFFGGLSTSTGAIKTAKSYADIEIIAMNRPREGGFMYSEREIEVMVHDAAAFIEAGADGIVFGCLNADGTIAKEQCARVLAALPRGAQSVFHRAFDVCVEPILESIDTLCELGFTRVLTSGKERTALLGAYNIKAMIEYARGRIEILPAGNIRAHNIQEILALTGAKQVHTSAFTDKIDATALQNPDILFTGVIAPKQGEYREICSQIVAGVVSASKTTGGK